MIIDTVEKWLRRTNRSFGVIPRRFEFCQCRNFSIFCCQLLSKPFSHFHKQTVHILTLVHKNKVCYQITRAYICTYSLFRDLKKTLVLQCSFDYSTLSLRYTGGLKQVLVYVVGRVYAINI